MVMPVYSRPLEPISRYKLRKLLKYGLVTFAVAGMLMLFSGDPDRRYLGAWFVLGIWTGILEEFFFGRRFRSLAVPLQILGKLLLVNLFTVAVLLLAVQVDPEVVLPGFTEAPDPIWNIFAKASFYKIILRVIVVTAIALIVVQLEELMGRRMFLGFLLGRYKDPKAEERVMLTIDLVGSTALAERMGDLRYFRFLNFTYSLMTEAVLHNEAEIHKYIGDEVIFTWPMRVGIRNENCLDLFFDIRGRMELHRGEFLREYGEVPEFRGALHGGRVISAQIGHIKRAIDFSGDLMNTLSRMLTLCKEQKEQVLVSADLLARLPLAHERFTIGEVSTVVVRGKRRQVRVHSLERKLLAR